LIPLRDATIRDGDVVVGYDKDMVTNAPPLEDDEGSLSRGQEEKLYDYYGIISTGHGLRCSLRDLSHRRRPSS